MPLKLQNYAVYVQCDGKELEMYDVRMDDEKTTSCWIPSESGKEFTVHYADESSATMMRITLDVDGRRMGSYACEKQSEGVIRDDEAAVSSTHLTSEIGTIEVTMTKADRFEEREHNYEGVGAVAKIGAIHEKSKKAGVHAISFGEQKKILPTKSLMAVGLQKEPFAVFKFRYRPLELLQATGVAPLPAKPKSGKATSNGGCERFTGAPCEV
ncbi:hypothetical protein C8Q80DRAFT_718352 [Daedaleopsis nitida]|nr:hypothetical protein C8Q80DRAFT_718352 [Daedaleopsis nitida]